MSDVTEADKVRLLDHIQRLNQAMEGMSEREQIFTLIAVLSGMIGAPGSEFDRLKVIAWLIKMTDDDGDQV